MFLFSHRRSNCITKHSEQIVNILSVAASTFNFIVPHINACIIEVAFITTNPFQICFDFQRHKKTNNVTMITILKFKDKDLYPVERMKR